MRVSGIVSSVFLQFRMRFFGRFGGVLVGVINDSLRSAVLESAFAIS